MLVPNPQFPTKIANPNAISSRKSRTVIRAASISNTSTAYYSKSSKLSDTCCLLLQRWNQRLAVAVEAVSGQTDTWNETEHEANQNDAWIGDAFRVSKEILLSWRFASSGRSPKLSWQSRSSIEFRDYRIADCNQVCSIRLFIESEWFYTYPRWWWLIWLKWKKQPC